MEPYYEVSEYKMESEGLEKVCKWHLGTTEPSPHMHNPLKARPLIHENILSVIGNTPMVRLSNIARAEGIKCELLAKCEYFNGGGSVKDRIGKRMIEDAEKSGRIKKGDILIEPTSGNTGIGLALSAAVKGYKMIITLPEKMSQEKVDVLKALGAEIIRTPTEAAFSSAESHIGVALKLNKELPNSHILDQYSNPSNPLVHYDETGEEIYNQCEGKVDHVVISAGTGGTVTGIARKLKEKIPGVTIVGVDPVGSILALPEDLNGEIGSYKVEGIGYDFIPRVLDRTVVDKWYKSSDPESFMYARRLIREEGLLCGGSSGTAIWAAIKYIKENNIGEGQRVVVILPDSIRNYMSKFLSVDWMIENKFLDAESIAKESDLAPIAKPSWTESKTVADLKIEPALTLNETNTCEEAITLLEKNSFNQFPVIGKNNTVIGVVTSSSLIKVLSNTKVKMHDPVSKAMLIDYRSISNKTSLKELTGLFNRHQYVVLEDEGIVGVVTHYDLLKFMQHNKF